MEQELRILPKHLRSHLLYSGICVVQSVVFCVISFVLFLLAIVLSVLRFRVSVPITTNFASSNPFMRSVLDSTLCDKVGQ